MHLKNLDKYIRSYVKSIGQFDGYYSVHKKVISVLISKLDLFDANDKTRFSNRKFISTLLWTNRDTCISILDKNKLPIKFDLIERELVSRKIYSDSIEKVYLYSIIKFFGQYTNNESVYLACHRLVNPNFIVSDSNIDFLEMEHLFTFNKNFMPKQTLRPDKPNGCNRLIKFGSSGLEETNYSMSNFYPKFVSYKKDIACKLVEQNSENLLCVLYYIDCCYWDYNKNISIDNFLKVIMRKFTPQYKRIITNSVKLVVDYSEQWSHPPNDMTIETEYIFNKSCEKILSEKLSLLDADRINGQNSEELIHMINDIITVTDDLCDEPDLDIIVKINLLKKLYEQQFLMPFDVYSMLIMSLAIIYKIKWISDYVQTIRDSAR